MRSINDNLQINRPFCTGGGMWYFGQALAVVSQCDAIVLDVMLPGMDGITLCRELREKVCNTHTF